MTAAAKTLTLRKVTITVTKIDDFGDDCGDHTYTFIYRNCTRKEAIERAEIEAEENVLNTYGPGEDEEGFPLYGICETRTKSVKTWKKTRTVKAA